MDPIDAAHAVVLDYPGGSESLAPRIGKGNSTLRQEVLRIGTAKLGLMDAVKITLVTRDSRIVAAFNEACGFCPPLPLPHHDITDGALQDLLERSAEVSSTVCDAFTEFQRDIADGKVTPNELTAFEARVLEAIGAMAILTQAMRAKAEQDTRTAIAAVTPLKRA